jgi:NAD(P)H dehydrogenase (quinone)|tara:strand:- start:2167 stop:2736 length:570 start_codon:yes stop_codon:yes gene_type:complete
MKIITIIYFSGTGNTKLAAEAVLQGCQTVDGVSVQLLEIVGADIIEGRWVNEDIATALDSSDAIIFGTPTYMGSVAGQMKTFMDAMAPRWYTSAWKDKIAAGFSVSSLAAGDKLNALQTILVFSMQMGMIWVGTGGNFSQGVNVHGFYLGAGLQSKTGQQEEVFSEPDINTAEFLGKRVAEVLTRSAAF